MDGLALTSVITSGVVGLSGGALTFFGPITAARQERRTKKYDRLANVYLSVLRLAELESRAITAMAADVEIHNNSGYGLRPAKVERLTAEQQAATVASLRAFGAKTVRDLFDVWRGAADAIEDEHEWLRFDWEVNNGGNPHQTFDTNKFYLELHPAERDARAALADAIARDLDKP